MPADPAISKEMLYSSDYPADKAVWLLAGSASIGAGVDVTIPHGLPFIPLISFVWSYTSDFTVTYDQNVGPFPSGNPGYYFSLQIAAEANSTNIILRGNGVASPTTVYYRLFAFEPTTSTATIAHTTNQSDEFKLSTDYSIPKLFTAGVINVPSGTTKTVTHNLGYIPQVVAWYNLSGTVYPMSYFLVTTGAPSVIVTTTQLIFNGDLLSTYDGHYRIYLDE